MPWKEVSIMSQRLEFVTLAGAAKANIRHLCRCYGISSATAYKWLHRFHSTGVNGLEDRSRRPHHSPSRSVVEMEEAIIDLRHKHPAWGGRKLRARLLALDHAAVPSSSTITAILRRHQLLDPKESAKHQAFQRYERASANELWQMDFKGEFKLPHGRCYPLTILDDHSRFAIALQACARNTRNITQTALIQVFRRYGLPDRITCDNGSP
ncbi:MAG: helix-turn-helix domain-containing protein, partial [Pyrinomonadaceae bacterium]